MNIKAGKIIKVITLILTIIVAFLIIYALYSNKSRFYNPETVRYSRITINENKGINDIIEEFTDNRTKDKFISEVKKVNNLSNLDNESVYGKTLFIPLIKN